MDELYRRRFNEGFSQELSERYAGDFERRLGTGFPFRLAETPVFLPSGLKRDLSAAAEAIVAQISDRGRIAAMMEAIPERWDTPGMDALPNFAQVDFAIVRDATGNLVPRLIELQGFPSLTAMQVIQRDAWSDALQSVPGLDIPWSSFFSGLHRRSFLDLARNTIVGDHDPHEVILMDLEPEKQKTYPDFAATRLLFGVEAVCPTRLIRKGRQLWRTGEGGGLVRVRRIYNRVVFDELEQKGTALPFDYREELEVEWAPHPNWYWVWSKYSLPFLDHPAVPKARFLSDVEELPADLQSRYVLKPLFSFAGGGVNVDPTPQDVAAIPPEQRRNWCLQEKIEYAPALQAADGGGVKVEIRMMFFRPDGEPRLLLGENLARLSRGKMLGVDFNKSFTWVGSSIALFPEL